LGGKVLAELQGIAKDLGIDGTSMRKGALIDAIKQARGDAPAAAKVQSDAPAAAKVQSDAPAAAKVQSDAPAAAKVQSDAPAAAKVQSEKPAAAKVQSEKPARAVKAEKVEKPAKVEKTDETEGPGKADQPADEVKADEAKSPDGKAQEAKSQDGGGRNRNNRQNDGGNGNNNGGGRNNQNQNKDNQNKDNQGGQNQGGPNRQQANQQNNNNDDDDDGTGRRRNRRGRNRNNRGMESEPTYSEDDVLVPAAGILDILDNYAFVRTTGYLASENDVYVSLSMVRKWNLRRGDAVTGQVRQPREGERKEKFNPMVKIETVNGMSLEESAKRVEFEKLTPLHPSERLRLEGVAGGLTGRVIDLVAPLGKGQRGLIVSPPKAGKTMVMQQVANAITENNPECHLMIVLVDERPEEVTDFQRTVKGEVIASTFDRPAADHTTVAELAIERAKRLVELGHDVVVLLDGLTRLGRAYNLAAPGSGRVMSGGVDSSALYPPKKFFGAARSIEDGGSLTILATALVETGSRMDEVLFEEFKDAGNWELRLSRELAEKRIFPAVDVVASSTRREETLLGAEELVAVSKLRRELADGAGQKGLESVLERLKKSSTNAEFIQQSK
jgi:transcription termination factor Rho